MHVPFPRAVATWVGRDVELARALDLLEGETLHLFYGVGGVGKSELVFKLVEEAQRRPRWAEVPAVVLAAQHGLGTAHLVAAVEAQLGIRRRRLGFTASGTAKDDLAELVAALEVRPTLLFLDDLHHLDPGEAAELLGYLSRHVRASRILVAARRELSLPPGTPPPVLHRLGPLDADATAELVRQLAARMGVAAPDVGAVFRRSGGSPFYVLRELAGDADGSGALDDTVRALPPEARRMLVALAASRTRPSVGDAQLLGGEAGADVLRELTRHLLVDVGRGAAMVHDLVRDAALRVATRRERAAAHRHLAELALAWAGDGGRPAVPSDAPALVEAVHHLLAAGDVDEAWTRCQDHYRVVAAAGLDHLLLESLRVLADTVDESRDEIGLMQARILVRRSLMAEAGEVLARLGPQARGGLRGLRLAAEVARRRGRLGEAELVLREARALAEGPTERFAIALELADISALRGHGLAAREVLSAALADHAEVSSRERARWGWSRALSYLIEERFADCAGVVARARAEIRGAGFDDLEVQLIMLEVLARAELDDLAGARGLLEREVRAAAGGALREHVGALYAGVVAHAAGELALARTELARAYDYLFDHGDQVMGSIAGYYLARVLLAQGEVGLAIEMSGRMSRVAQAAELDTLAAHGRATAAEALLVAGRAAEARALAETTIAGAWIGAQARRLTLQTLARLAALDGDLGAARRHLELAGAQGPRVGSDESMALAPEAAVAMQRASTAAAIDLERAGLELHGGDPRVAVAAAGRALDHYRRVGRRGAYSRALVARAAALHAADPGGVIEADVLVAEALAIAVATGHVRVRARCALLRAAARARRGDGAGARTELLAAVHAGVAGLDHGEGVAIRAALDEASPVPGQRALLATLGLAPGARHRVIGRGGARVVDDRELARTRGEHLLVVEPVRAVITGTVGSQVRIDRGRPLACELLAALVEAAGAVISTEQLFLSVWGGREYHPLRHRNTVYVAVKRLRQTLRALLEDEREVIETAAGGWRLADDVDAIVVRPVDD